MEDTTGEGHYTTRSLWPRRLLIGSARSSSRTGRHSRQWDRSLSWPLIRVDLIPWVRWHWLDNLFVGHARSGLPDTWPYEQWARWAHAVRLWPRRQRSGIQHALLVQTCVVRANGPRHCWQLLSRFHMMKSDRHWLVRIFESAWAIIDRVVLWCCRGPDGVELWAVCLVSSSSWEA